MELTAHSLQVKEDDPPRLSLFFSNLMGRTRQMKWHQHGPDKGYILGWSKNKIKDIWVLDDLAEQSSLISSDFDLNENTTSV